MESVNKSFDANEVFSGVEKSLEKYKSVDLDDIFEEGKVCSALSIEIVSGLTDILRSVPKMPDSEIIDRVCEFLTWSVIMRMKYGCFSKRERMVKC